MEYNILIELDGLQHFEQVANWTDPKITMEKDIYKMKQALSHGYTIIRLLQEDVWKDKNDWINKLSLSIKQYDIPIIIFLDDKRYTQHKILLNTK